jgi:hypothetical protein
MRGEVQLSAMLLKRFLSIFSDRIFDSRVDLAIPSLAAAPEGPNTRPLHLLKRSLNHAPLLRLESLIEIGLVVSISEEATAAVTSFHRSRKSQNRKVSPIAR